MIVLQWEDRQANQIDFLHFNFDDNGSGFTEKAEISSVARLLCLGIAAEFFLLRDLCSTQAPEAELSPCCQLSL